MKRLFSIIAAVAILSSCGILQNLDSTALTYAAGNVLSAATITDDQIAQLSAQSVAQMDKENKVNSGTYAQRLSKLTKNLSVDGLSLNFKVYETSEVNAFACGDGSIRVYTGLMDVMDDDELMAIIGHEIGHVVHKDTKKAMQRAYMGCAARNALIAAGGVVAALSASVVGELADSFVSAQYSQQQEYKADEYGYQFAIDTGHSPYSMAKALEKLVELNGNSATSSNVAKMFSSHPDSEKRASIVRSKADSYVASQNK